MASNFLRIALSASAGVAIGLLGVFLYAQTTLESGEETRVPLRTQPRTAPPPTASASAEPAAPVAASASATAKPASFKLSVSPAFAGVSVEGKALEVSNGTVELSGAPGTVVHVRLAVGGSSKSFPVRITEAGLEPSAIAFGPVATPARAAPIPPTTAPLPAPTASAPAPPPAGDDLYE